ncbi:hypothetical protein FC65_GL000293 [Ligilactobacillus acidipiscis DSM 15836]|uniref:Uncharacterized protein n=1 Tax=Ligilactobacillus acidipiscis DSM 15836 TaxID=1423716 RepID=A0ABR5PIS2_9LACO|nr:hypothetical protein FC65_GL000293 [Ligilactobacillus acidipiscis DSM 15836]
MTHLPIIPVVLNCNKAKKRVTDHLRTVTLPTNVWQKAANYAYQIIVWVTS